MSKQLILATHLFLARYAAGTADADNKPAADDAAWKKAGIIESLSLTPNIQEDQVTEPMPGMSRRTDVIEWERTNDFAFTVKGFNAIIFQLIFGTADLSAGASVQYNPSEGRRVKAWMKMQQYSVDDNSLVNVVDIWASLKLGGAVNFARNARSDIPLTGMEIWSTLNTGTLSNLS